MNLDDLFTSVYSGGWRVSASVQFYDGNQEKVPDEEHGTKDPPLLGPFNYGGVTFNPGFIKLIPIKFGSNIPGFTTEVQPPSLSATLENTNSTLVKKVTIAVYQDITFPPLSSPQSANIQYGTEKAISYAGACSGPGNCFHDENTSAPDSCTLRLGHGSKPTKWDCTVTFTLVP